MMLKACLSVILLVSHFSFYGSLKLVIYRLHKKIWDRSFSDGSPWQRVGRDQWYLTIRREAITFITFAFWTFLAFDVWTFEFLIRLDTQNKFTTNLIWRYQMTQLLTMCHGNRFILVSNLYFRFWTVKVLDFFLCNNLSLLLLLVLQVAKRLMHRPVLVFRQPNLLSIDGIPVTIEERTKAELHFIEQQVITISFVPWS